MQMVKLSPLKQNKTAFRLAAKALLCAPLVATIATMTPQATKAEVEAEMAGVSAAVTGEITLAKVTGEVGVLVESGMPVYLGDRITTSAGAGMQVLLLDETVFTIGPNSDIAIDEFVYDPETGDGRIVADMAKGVMRFVTGKIPLNNPSSMDVNLPVGSIGIRGTIGLIRSMTAEQANQIVPGSFDTTDPDTANQPVFMAVNQGPGLSRNDTTSRPGAFAAFNQNGGSQNVTGENFGVFVSNNNVTPPTRFPSNAATFDFSANVVRTTSSGSSSDSGSGNGNSNGSSSGSSGGQQPVVTSQQTGQAQNQTGETSAQAVNVAMAQIGTVNSASNVTETTSILNNNTESSSSEAYTFDALRTVTGGSATTGPITVSQNGLSYTFDTTVDYENRSIDIYFSNVSDSSQLSNGLATMEGFEYNTSSQASGRVAFDSSNFELANGCDTYGCNPSVVFTDATNVEFEMKTNDVPQGASSSETLSQTN